MQIEGDQLGSVVNGNTTADEQSEMDNNQAAQTIPHHMIIPTIAKQLQDNLLIIPMGGWDAIVSLIKELGSEELQQAMTDLQIPMAPIQCFTDEDVESSSILGADGQPARKDEGSNIILPG